MTGITDPITTLPIASVQPSFPSVFQDVYDGLVPYENVWASGYRYPDRSSGQPHSDSAARSVHGKIQLVLDESNRDQINFITREGDVKVTTRSIKKLSNINTFEVECQSLGIPKTTLATPLQEYSDGDTANPRQPQRITAFDVSSDETQFAVGHLDGSVYIYPVTRLSPLNNSKDQQYIPQTIAAHPSHKKRSKPHLSGVSCIQFFPSSRVLLTGGLDFALTIISAEPSTSSDDIQPQSANLSQAARTTTTQEPQRLTPVRVMRSHTRSISSVGIVAPGKNVVSSSLDSTVKIWDVPSGSVVSTLLVKAPVLSMTLGERTSAAIDALASGLGSAAEGAADMEVDGQSPTAVRIATAPPPQVQPETHSQLALCGLENGSFEIFDLRTRSPVHHYTITASPQSIYGGVSAIAYDPSRNVFATGTSKGIATLYDIRVLPSSSGSSRPPLARFGRNGAGVEDLAFIDLEEGSVVGMVIAPSDGLPYVAGVEGQDPRVVAELVGVDCDSVSNVRVRNGSVWCASDDAMVRRYSVC